MRDAVFSAHIVIAPEGFGRITVVGTEIPAYTFEKRRHSGMAMRKIDMSTLGQLRDVVCQESPVVMCSSRRVSLL